MKIAAGMVAGLLSLVLMLALAPPAAATHVWATAIDEGPLLGLPPVEERINLLGPCITAQFNQFGPPPWQLPIMPDIPDQEYPANTPFFVAHGWSSGPIPWDDPERPPETREAFMSPTSAFELWIDDGLQRSIMHAPVIVLPDFGALKLKTFVIEDHDGLTGSHTFTGLWFLDASFLGGELGERFLVLHCTMTIHFVDV